MFKYLESPLSQPPYLELFQSKGGAVEAFLGRASLETFSGEARLKNHPVVRPIAMRIMLEDSNDRRL